MWTESNAQRKNEEAINGIDITDTQGDVIGAGIKGTGHIIGKDIDYTSIRKYH